MSVVTVQADKKRQVLLLTVEQTKALRVRQWDTFTTKLYCFLASKRGAYSELARQIGVSRQTVWRWFGPGYRSMPPAWAGVVANIWYHEQQAQLKEIGNRSERLSRPSVTKQLR